VLFEEKFLLPLEDTLSLFLVENLFFDFPFFHFLKLLFALPIHFSSKLEVLDLLPFKAAFIVKLPSQHRFGLILLSFLVFFFSSLALLLVPLPLLELLLQGLPLLQVSILARVFFPAVRGADYQF
jgi:hypothetical protein